MRDTSEFPDANEQAKTPGTRTRSTARSKAESTPAGSQEQDPRAATRRRTGPGTNGTAHTQNSAPNSAAPAQPAARQNSTSALPQRNTNAGTQGTRSGGQTQGQRSMGQGQRPSSPQAPQRSGGQPYPSSATARYRVSVPVEVAACQRREDGLYRRRVPAGAARVGREAARVQEVRRQAGSRAIRGQDSDRHRDLDRGRGVPAPRGA